MKHTILIERWKKEACEIIVDAVDTEDAQEQALSFYLVGHLDAEFKGQVKQERLTVFNEDEDRVKTTELNTYGTGEQ